MSKITGLTMNSNLIKPYRVRAGTGVLYVADQDDADPLYSEANNGMPTSLACVGLTDGAISISPNIDTADITSDQMYTVYDQILTGFGFTVDLTLDQTGLYNIQLALGLLDDAVVTGAATKLKFNADLVNTDYYAVQIKCNAPREGSSTGSPPVQVFNFWKCKLFASGGMDISSESKTSLPISIACLGNSQDSVGFLEVDTAVTAPVPAWGAL